MLQSHVSRSDRHRGSTAAPASDANIGALIDTAISFVRRRFLLIVTMAVAVIGLGVGYLKLTPPTFTAVVQVLLETPKAQYVQQASPLSEPNLDFAQIETQIQIVRSPALANLVIEQQNLYNDPDLTRAPLSIKGLVNQLRDRLWPRPVEPEPVEVSALTRIRPFLARLDVRRLGVSNIIEISYSSSRAAQAADVANAVAQAYIDDQSKAKSTTARRAVDWLRDRLGEIGDQAQAAQREVDAYKASKEIVYSNGKSIDEQQIFDLNSRLIAANAQASDALAKLNRFEAILRVDAPEATDVATLGAAVADALNSPIINSLRTEHMTLQRREIEWSARYGPRHSAVMDLQKRMQGIRNSIREELRRFAETSRNEYEVAAKRQQAIARQLNDTVSQSRKIDKAEVGLGELDAKAKGYRSLYETFQQRYMGAVQLQSFPISEARVIAAAFPPDSKSKPKSPMVLGLSAFLGIGLGVGLGLLRELTDGVFRTPAQLETALQLPCISLVPRVPAFRGRQAQGGDPDRRLAASGRTVDSLVVGAPLSHYAESIRAIMIEIELGPTGGRYEVIGVTSALTNEGKTTLSTSLARLMAHGGKRVLLVDGDLRNPSLSAAMAPGAAVGLVEVVKGATPLDEAIWKDPKTDLDVLPVVYRERPIHTSEFLASPATRALFERLRSAYDLIVVDLPPLSPVVDARASGSFVDGYVLAVEWGKTRIETIRRALHDAPNVRENVIGAVLNKTDMKALSRYDRRESNIYNYELYQNRQVGLRG